MPAAHWRKALALPRGDALSCASDVGSSPLWEMKAWPVIAVDRDT